MELPESFMKRMKNILGDGYNSFISSYNEDKQPGMRINTLNLNIKYI